MSNRAIPHAIALRLKQAATARAIQRFTAAATARAMAHAILPATVAATALATRPATPAPTVAAARAGSGARRRVAACFMGFSPSTITSVLRYQRW